MVMRAQAVQNKAANPIQITSEQLLIDAQFHRNKEISAPRQGPINEEELDDYKFRTRKDFEQKVSKQRIKMSDWIRYAEWEASL